MASFFATLVEALASPARAALHRWRDRLGRELLLFGLALSAACGSLVFLSAAGHFLLASVTSAWLAALIIGLALLLLASALIWVARRKPSSPSSAVDRGTATSDETRRLSRALAQCDIPPADLVLTSLPAGWALSVGLSSGRARSRTAPDAERNTRRPGDSR